MLWMLKAFEPVRRGSKGPCPSSCRGERSGLGGSEIRVRSGRAAVRRRLRSASLQLVWVGGLGVEALVLVEATS